MSWNVRQQIEQMITDPKMVWQRHLHYKASLLLSMDQVVLVIAKMLSTRQDRNMYSDTFFTHHEGYKMCVGFSFGRNYQLRIFLRLVRG